MVMSFRIYLWPWAWNGFRKIRPDPYLCNWLWSLSASASKCEKATFKEAEQRVISVSLYSPFRSPLWWPYSCWLRSVTTTSSMPRSTNVPCPWTSSVPYPGVCSCLVIHVAETEFFKGIDLLHFLFFTENVFVVVFIFQDGEFWYCQVPVWLPVSLLWIKTTVTVRQRQTLDSMRSLLLRILWRKINPIMSLPPCGDEWAYIFLVNSLIHVKYLHLYKINAILAI